MTQLNLADLGWSDHFTRQAGESPRAARISAIHRGRLEALSPEGPLDLTPKGAGLAFAVGDFILHDGTRPTERLVPETEIARRSAGTAAAERQLIAANVGTLGIVTSCNADFSVPRLERYLAMAEASGCLPLILLTKADLTEDPAAFLRQAERLSPLVTALALDARDTEEAAKLEPWLRPGMTLALVGSSGTGKTTLLNALSGLSERTGGLRGDDRGRHHTTFRSLRQTRFGGWIIDTPGMRELGMEGASEGIDVVFSDVSDLAAGCRFSDCRHESEPGCAVKAAVDAGELDAERLARWQKLRREDRHNSESIAEARARFRRFGKTTAHGNARREAKEAGWEEE
ncbi:ribosome small subunit-dependent GTPase A [Pseudoroseicyclus tamaricis]|uniref:Small ribosomal subunit biogenesis GTPase RsgA n=1 Tax=Pseudoroseicyclus tamaricis TaxID=2705421 RepID=A0A6B2JUW5_9RHOB|nr:ribosome small subunit-dependent GTPase A [Pseudoroseicyclus tamaricis]NDV02128.1 ribosome small subunit-dependent GTPase A [Pseudoroseicyclus tamaricis]